MAVEYIDRKWSVKIQTESTGQAIEFTGLDIEFKSEKTLDPEPNAASITVYGLSPSNRHAIEALNLYDPKKIRGAKDNATVGETKQKRPTTVSRAPKVGHIRCELTAGYASGTSLIFRMDMRRALTVDEPPEIRMEIEGEDGGRSMLSSRVTHSFPSGTSKFEVVQELAEALGLGLGNIREVSSKLRGQYSHGTTVNGSAHAALQRVLRTENLHFSVQNGVLSFRDPKANRVVRGLLISPETGMIGSPKRNATGAVMVETLLIPDVAPGQYIQLESKDFKGAYLVRSVESEGSSFGGKWGHTLECWPA